MQHSFNPAKNHKILTAKKALPLLKTLILYRIILYLIVNK